MCTYDRTDPLREALLDEIFDLLSRTPTKHLCAYFPVIFQHSFEEPATETETEPRDALHIAQYQR